MLGNLHAEQNDLVNHIRRAAISDDQLSYSYTEGFCAKIRTGLDRVDFKTKRQIIQLPDIRDKIAYERALHLRCLIDTQEQLAVSRIQISPLSSIGAIAIMNCDSPPMVPSL
jgi:hypothetical protein